MTEWLSTNEEMLRERVEALAVKLRECVRETMREQGIAAASQVAREEDGDTIFAIDVAVEEVLFGICDEWSREVPFMLVAEGIEPHGQRMFPPSADAAEACFWIIIDPVDGSRNIMYDKRSAWVLIGAAPPVQPQPHLQDVRIAVQAEIPTTKQYLADLLSVGSDGKVRVRRDNVLTGETIPIHLHPSGADGIEHSFVYVSNFFPGGKGDTAALEDDLIRALVGEVPPGKAIVYTDQYISTGGQLYELMAGHDRFGCDLRSIVNANRGAEIGLCVRPYDICTFRIAERLGCAITAPNGAPLDAPLDTSTNLSWVGYANQNLHRRIAPELQRLLTERGYL